MLERCKTFLLFLFGIRSPKNIPNDYECCQVLFFKKLRPLSDDHCQSIPSYCSGRTFSDIVAFAAYRARPHDI